MGEDQRTHIQRCLDRWHAGETVAHAELFQGADERLRMLAGKLFQKRRGLQRREDHDAVLQNASLQLWRSLEKVRPQSPRHFLNLGAQHIRWELINLSRHYIGPEGAAPKAESLPSSDNESTGTRTPARPADNSGDADDLASRPEFHERIEGLLESERELWNLLWYYGMKLTQAAAELGVSERDLRYRWQQARLEMVRALKHDLPGEDANRTEITPRRDATGLSELLLRWEELQDQGRAPTPEEHCRDWPELLDTLRRRIADLRLASAPIEMTGQEVKPVDGENTRRLDHDGPAAPQGKDGPPGGASIPGYEILDVLGRGGMSVVYKARQLSLKRLVGLKMILSGTHAGPHELARLRAEAVTIARLKNPSIVQIHEVGEHEGRPYMALEFVEGGSLAQKLNGVPQAPREAAKLVETLARAVHAAHQEGIVHRDLKPANILLHRKDEAKRQGDRETVRQGENEDLGPVSLSVLIPKITDFGLAKRLDVDTSQTKSGDIMGTSSYMAPEQAAGKPKKVGPASDVYALGAILYEMLVGRPPFRGETTLDTLEQVRVQEPVSPSRLRPKLPRDLATICLKCLQKEPHKRYASAEALAEDLRHFLAGEPILARPVGLGEKAWKWSRRRPAWTALALVSLGGAMSLVAGGVWHTVQMGQALKNAREAEVHADQERRKAEGLHKQAQLAAEQARNSAATARSVTDFLAGIFQASDAVGLHSYEFQSRGQNGADLTARQLLDRGAQRVITELKNEPVVQAAMMDILGNVLRSQGEYEQAGKLLEQGLAIRQCLFGEEHLEVATSLFHLGWLRHDLGSYAEAEQLYRNALAIRQKLLGKDHLLVADTLFNLGWLQAHQLPDRNPSVQRLAEAERLFEEVLCIRREKLGNEHRDVAFTLAALAAVLYGRGDADLKALALATQAVAIFQMQENPELTGKGFILFLQGQNARRVKKFDEAERLHRQVLEMARRQLGDRHPITGMLLGNLAGLLRDMGDLAGAEKAIREALKIGRRSPMRWHPVMAECLVELADHVRDRDGGEEAEELYREALMICKFRLPREHKLSQQTVTKLAAHLKARGQHEEADDVVKTGW